MDLLTYQRHFARVCFAERVPEEDLASLGGDAGRWRIYRDMVRARLRQMAGVAFARSVESVGTEAFDACFARYLAACGPESPLIREVITALGEFALADPALSLRPFARDLLRFELTKWRLAYLPGPSPCALRSFDFDGPPVLTPAFEVLRLDHPVQRDDATPEDAAATCLFVYRPEDRGGVRWWPSDAFGARLFERFLAGEACVPDVVRAAAEDVGETLDEGLLQRLSALLALAVERGILLGTRDEAPVAGAGE